MRKPLFTVTAETDLSEILLYIANDNSTAALDWIDKIESRCLLLAQNPEMGELRPELGEGVRSISIGRYVLFHHQIAEGVEILRILAGDQDIQSLSNRR